MPLRIKNGRVKACGVKKSNIDILTDQIKKASIKCDSETQSKSKNRDRKYIIF